MTTTSIEWTRGDDGVEGASWNPSRGCSLASAGCTNCYAMKQAHRFSGEGKPYEGLTVLGKHGPRWTGEVRFVPDMLELPLRWRKPRRIFVNSMSDLFHSDITNEQIAAVFGVMAACPRHTFMVLTKRAERMAEWFKWAEQYGAGFSLLRLGMADGLLTCAHEAVSGDAWVDIEPPFDCMSPTPEIFGTSWPLPNVWLGVSAENQATADERIPLLLQTPAAVRWVSAEPLLGPIEFGNIRSGCIVRDALRVEQARQGLWAAERHLDWVVCGGESGPGARSCEVAWIRSIVEQCKAAGVPVFVKQLGAKPLTFDVIMQPDGSTKEEPVYLRLRDKKGGDPREWNADLHVREFPR